MSNYQTDDFRADKEWRRVRKELRDEAGAVCPECGELYAALNPAVIVTKKLPKDGGDWKDKSNFKVTCRRCHWLER